MYNYLNTKQTVNKLNKRKLDFFYWKYIYGDIIISKFITFLIKNGYKNKAIRFFFKALYNLKLKFGINPILLIKYVILKRNVLHKVTKKKVKRKTFFYLRLLDFDRQISSTIKKIMELIFFIKEKKKLKLWQSIFVVLLNFCIVKNKKKKNILVDLEKGNYFLSVKKTLRRFSLYRIFSKINSYFFAAYVLLKKIIFLLSMASSFYISFFLYLLRSTSYININSSFLILYIFSFFKLLLHYLWVIKYRLFRLKKRYLLRLQLFRIKLRRFFLSFRRLKKKYKVYKSKRLKLYKRKKYLLKKNKNILRNKFKQHFLTRFFFKELGDLKKASKFKNSFLNFKLINKKKRELKMGTRVHKKYDIRLRHRKIFFRISKYGQ